MISRPVTSKLELFLTTLNGSQLSKLLISVAKGYLRCNNHCKTFIQIRAFGKHLMRRAPLEAESVPQRYSFKKVFFNYTANLKNICLKERLWKQKQSPRGVLLNRCSANMQQICRTSVQKNTFGSRSSPPEVFF